MAISRHHLTRNVVEAMYHCNKCGKSTMHTVSNGHKGSCISCMARHDESRDQKRTTHAPATVQIGLF